MSDVVMDEQQVDVETTEVAGPSQIEVAEDECLAVPTGADQGDNSDIADKREVTAGDVSAPAAVEPTLPRRSTSHPTLDPWKHTDVMPKARIAIDLVRNWTDEVDKMVSELVEHVFSTLECDPRGPRALRGLPAVISHEDNLKLIVRDFPIPFEMLDHGAVEASMMFALCMFTYRAEAIRSMIVAIPSFAAWSGTDDPSASIGDEHLSFELLSFLVQYIGDLHSKKRKRAGDSVNTDHLLSTRYFEWIRSVFLISLSRRCTQYERDGPKKKNTRSTVSNDDDDDDDYNEEVEAEKMGVNLDKYEKDDFVVRDSEDDSEEDDSEVEYVPKKKKKKTTKRNRRERAAKHDDSDSGAENEVIEERADDDDDDVLPVV